jgi:hypothetical protein
MTTRGSPGTWERLVTHTELAAAGTGWFESPRIDWPLQAGEQYLLLAGVEGMATFHYSLGLGAPAYGLTPLGTALDHWVPADVVAETPDVNFSTRQRVTLAVDDSASPLCPGASGTSSTGSGSGGTSCSSCAGSSLSGPSWFAAWFPLSRR